MAIGVVGTADGICVRDGGGCVSSLLGLVLVLGGLGLSGVKARLKKSTTGDPGRNLSGSGSVWACGSVSCSEGASCSPCNGVSVNT